MKLAETEGQTVYLFISILSLSFILLHLSSLSLPVVARYTGTVIKLFLVAITIWKTGRFMSTKIYLKIKLAGSITMNLRRVNN